eukprot:6308552-Alexandrium_andersonii.AAC.1
MSASLVGSEMCIRDRSSKGPDPGAVKAAKSWLSAGDLDAEEQGSGAQGSQVQKKPGSNIMKKPRSNIMKKPSSNSN